MSGTRAAGTTTRPHLAEIAATVARIGDRIEALPDDELEDPELTAQLAHLIALVGIRRAERKHREAHQ